MSERTKRVRKKPFQLIPRVDRAKEWKDAFEDGHCRHSMAEVIGLTGAFNFDVCMEMPYGHLCHILDLHVKTMALVAESGSAGAGDLLFNVMKGGIRSYESQKKFLRELEAITVYGCPYEELSSNKRKVANECQFFDEQAHFSRIMQSNALHGVKKIVGTTDAGNDLIARLMINVVRYREQLGIASNPPLPHGAVVENADFKHPLSPCQVRRNYPYTGCVVSASSVEVAQCLLEIYRKLVCQYPLQVVMMMIEEWIMAAGIEDEDISLTTAQVWRPKESGPFAAQVLNLGGGAVTVSSGGNYKTEIFRGGQSFVGDINSQPFLEVRKFELSEQGGTLILFPQNWISLPSDMYGHLTQSALEQTVMTHKYDPSRYGWAYMRIHPRTHLLYQAFKWTEEYVRQTLGPLVQRIREINPLSVSLMFGHVHSDRDPNEDQDTAAFIGGVLGRVLQGSGINVETNPMCDNYHVVDRIDYAEWLRRLAKASQLEITEVQHEGSLLTRHLGDELVSKVMTSHPEKIVRQGGNVYLDAGNGMMIELYDGIGDGTVPGRQACVPFQTAWEMVRWNSRAINTWYREYLLRQFPGSMVAQWWGEEPDATYQWLMHRRIYSKPPREREELKRKKNAEIDRPFNKKIGQGFPTPMLGALLGSVDLNRVMTIDVLEGFYDAQWLKFRRLMEFLKLPFPHWRISFNRQTGNIKPFHLREEDAV
ncbi:MAG: hypothetical protein HYW65_03010 [Candidatus Liptonbacteria bacterium]|nr:hypothetical protein [Candidatus Liptonbacteria bacterium]